MRRTAVAVPPLARDARAGLRVHSGDSLGSAPANTRVLDHARRLSVGAPVHTVLTGEASLYSSVSLTSCDDLSRRRRASPVSRCLEADLVAPVAHPASSPTPVVKERSLFESRTRVGSTGIELGLVRRSSARAPCSGYRSPPPSRSSLQNGSLPPRLDLDSAVHLRAPRSVISSPAAPTGFYLFAHALRQPLSALPDPARAAARGGLGGSPLARRAMVPPEAWSVQSVEPCTLLCQAKVLTVLPLLDASFSEQFYGLKRRRARRIEMTRRDAFVESQGRGLESRLRSRLTKRQIWLSLIELVSTPSSSRPPRARPAL